MVSRRKYLLSLAGSVASAWAQGVASRNIKPMPRGKPSGLPFHARFTDIAAAAGLREPVIYGGVDRKQYILETVGCGAAFIDYDNDGWLDIFLLSGTSAGRRARPAPPTGSTRTIATARSRTSPKRPACARGGWASAVCGRRFQQRRLRRSVRHLLGTERPVPEQRRWHVYRRHREGRPAPRTANAMGLRLHLRRLQPRRPAGSVCRQLPGVRFQIRPEPGRTATATGKELPVNCGPRGLPPGSRVALSQQWRRHVHRCERQRPGIGKGQGELRHDRRGRRLRQRRLAGHLRGLRFHSQLSVPQQSRRHIHRHRAGVAAWR